MTRYALVGNPNSGKTSLFNILTGTRQQVGNWTGVTVEKKIGYLKDEGANEIIDLPGVYSISPFSEDERVANNFLITEKYDSIINIVDSSNLERNLYLTLQLIELGKPMILSFNMIDVAKAYGYQFDIAKMEEILGIPIIPMAVRKGEGITEFKNALKTTKIPTDSLRYTNEIEDAIRTIVDLLAKDNIFAEYNPRWLAIQILEDNQIVEELFIKHTIWEEVALIKQRLATSLQQTIPEEIREIRYKWIQEFINKIQITNSKLQKTWTERIDAIVTHRWLGIPLFFFFMFLTFQITFSWVGAPLQDLLDSWFSGPVTDFALKLLTITGASDWLVSLVIDGIIAGVGGVLVFIPQIFTLFLIISFLEDSGYMARAAFIMDKAMSRIGLNGKAFIPMIIGFGCNVPGIMSARTIEQPKERLITILISPFMSCSARLTVYALFVSIFFEEYQSLVVLSLYLLGIIMAALVGLLFKRFLIKEDESLFVIELPPYRVPMLRNLLLNTWDKGKNFIKKAGTIILSMAVVIWFLGNFSWSGMVSSMNDSFLAALGGVIAPIFEPLGFGTWQVGVALISGFMAKEIVVSTLSIVYGAGGDSLTSLSSAVQTDFNAASAYAFMIFILLYTPCMATAIAMKEETGSWKWPLFSIAYSFTIAWVLAFIAYRIGSLIIQI